MAGQPLGSPYESARELERAPHHYPAIQCIGTPAHPLTTRLRDHAEPQSARPPTRQSTREHTSLHHPRTPFLGSAHERQLSSVARPALTSTGADETSRQHAARSRALPSCGQWNATTRSLQRLRSAMRSLRSLITHVARCLRGYRCRTTAAVATHRAGCDHARSWHPLQDTAPRRSTAGRAGTPSTRREPRSAR